MDIANFDALKAQGRILDAANVDPEQDYFLLGKYTNKYTTDNFKYTKYPVWAIKAGDVMGVQSVTGLNTDNTDPFNPIVKISVDGVTIIGEGTPASPLAVQTKYKVYTALLTQTGTNAPVATVLENTIGNIIWSYDDTGVYLANLLGAFTLDKTFSLMTLFITSNRVTLNSFRVDDNIFGINVNELDLPGNAIELDGVLQIEIRVYN
jgi:hypothetical protein